MTSPLPARPCGHHVFIGQVGTQEELESESGKIPLVVQVGMSASFYDVGSDKEKVEAEWQTAHHL